MNLRGSTSNKINMALSGRKGIDPAGNQTYLSRNMLVDQTEVLRDLDVDFSVRVTGLITEEQWNRAKPLVERMYIEEGEKFQVVAKEIKTAFGFCPT
jgi:hypothetical protein